MSYKRTCIYKVNPKDIDKDKLMSPWFKIDASVKLKEVPTTGAEFLLKTIKEREQYPNVLVCKKDLSKYARNQSRFVEEIPKPKVPINVKPTKEWQNIQVADFSDIRMYVSKQLAKKSDWSEEKNKLGEIPNSWNAWKKFLETTDPKLSVVICLNTANVDSALQVFIQMMDEVTPGNTIDHKSGQWIYSLLACTKEPLVTDTICILRSLARKCAEIRSHLNPDDEDIFAKAAPLNLFICLISRYFRQYDLSD